MTSAALAQAQRRYQANRERQIRAGTWRGLVDAAPARDHVRNMKRIWLISDVAIAAAVGLQKSTVSYLMEGRADRGGKLPERISARVSDAILSFTLDDLPSNTRINAIGSARRLQALAVKGWPLRAVAARGAAVVTRLSVIRSGQPPTVFYTVAQGIRHAAEELEQLDPLDHLPKASVSYTRTHAAAQGWLPAAAWADAIDEPDAKPWEMIRCSHPTCIHGSKDERLLCSQHLRKLHRRGTLDGQRLTRNGRALIEDVQFILATDPPINPDTDDLDRDRLAERLGTSREALERALLRANIRVDGLWERA